MSVAKGNIIAEVSIVPIGTGSSSLSKYVADCIDVIQERPEVKYQLTPMGTILEGPMDSVLETIKRMHEVPFNKGVNRVVTTIKIDDRRDILVSMERKVKSVLTKIHKKKA
jgi:uncharacterized protein (TIGR00106 family)